MALSAIAQKRLGEVRKLVRDIELAYSKKPASFGPLARVEVYQADASRSHRVFLQMLRPKDAADGSFFVVVESRDEAVVTKPQTFKLLSLSPRHLLTYAEELPRLLTCIAEADSELASLCDDIDKGLRAFLPKRTRTKKDS